MSVYVLDASVAVSSSRGSDPNHQRAVRGLRRLLKEGLDSIVVPSLFGVEVASALARAGVAEDVARLTLDAFLARARVITLGARAAHGASRVAARTRLRAADAIYVWVAEREGLPLVTFDGEILARASAVGVTAMAPP